MSISVFPLMIYELPSSPTYLHDQNGARNWASEVRELLTKVGCDDVWHNQSVGNISTSLAECKLRLLENFVDECFTTVTSSERYGLYSIIAESFRKCEYMDWKVDYWKVHKVVSFGQILLF